RRPARGVSLAGPQGFEPRPTGPKPGVLPLDDGPTLDLASSRRRRNEARGPPVRQRLHPRALSLGWPTGTRTPTDGTRIRCPAIRRWANGKRQSTNARAAQSSRGERRGGARPDPPAHPARRPRVGYTRQRPCGPGPRATSGEVPEWLNGTVSKTVVRPCCTVGSNPTLSANRAALDGRLLR